MSRLVVQVVRHQESSVATAVVELSPGQPVRYETPDRMVEGVLNLEGPLPLAALVRQVLTRYGLEPASETDNSPRETEEVVVPARDRGGWPA